MQPGSDPHTLLAQLLVQDSDVDQGLLGLVLRLHHLPVAVLSDGHIRPVIAAVEGTSRLPTGLGRLALVLGLLLLFLGLLGLPFELLLGLFSLFELRLLRLVVLFALLLLLAALLQGNPFGAGPLLVDSLEVEEDLDLGGDGLLGGLLALELPDEVAAVLDLDVDGVGGGVLQFGLVGIGQSATLVQDLGGGRRCRGLGRLSGLGRSRAGRGWFPIGAGG